MLENIQKKLNKEELSETLGLQQLFRDDLTVIFRKLPIKHTALQEIKNDTVIRGWKHFYKTQYPFNGYKGLPSGMVTLSFERDIVLDPHEILDENDLPPKHITPDDMTAFKDIAWSRANELSNQRKDVAYFDKLTIALGIFLFMEAIGILIKVAT